ncbi:unnamed protein product [Mesocestoides corti]|uniref:Origin recognition complex subunit 2 n=1 Tax=Mesocestoides corti TaxID=53468 RepID=A0A0R3UJE0_MESCO|nr:unnamed protein product [Mesocestoides corti]
MGIIEDIFKAFCLRRGAWGIVDMNWLLPQSVLGSLDVDPQKVCRESTLLLCTGGDSGASTRNVVSELLLNAANRAALEDLSVFYFRPCELVNLSQLHIHGTPALDFSSWDCIRFMYPSADSLVRYFCHFHQCRQLPDLIVIEQLDRIINADPGNFASSLYSLTCLLTDALAHLRNAASAQDHGVDCHVLVSCALTRDLWRGQSPLSSQPLPHALAQACVFTSEGDDSHFSMAESLGAFEFKLFLRQNEIFFSSFLSNNTFLRLLEPVACV